MRSFFSAVGPFGVVAVLAFEDAIAGFAGMNLEDTGFRELEEGTKAPRKTLPAQMQWIQSNDNIRIRDIFQLSVLWSS